MGETFDKVTGKAKELEGRLTGDKARERQGVADQVKGDLKGIAHKTETAAKNIANTVTGAFKRTRKRA